MQRDIAEKLMELLNRMWEPFNEATELIGQIPSEDEQRALRRGLGEGYARVYVDVMLRIIREHPDLDPDRDEPWLKTLKDRANKAK
jgi:hypothetical protein